MANAEQTLEDMISYMDYIPIVSDLPTEAELEEYRTAMITKTFLLADLTSRSFRAFGALSRNTPKPNSVILKNIMMLFDTILHHTVVDVTFLKGPLASKKLTEFEWRESLDQTISASRYQGDQYFVPGTEHYELLLARFKAHFQTKRVELKTHLKKTFLEPLFKGQTALNLGQWQDIIMKGVLKRTQLIAVDQTLNWDDLSDSSKQFFFAHFRQHLAPQSAQDFMLERELSEADVKAIVTSSSVRQNPAKKTSRADLPAPSPRRKTTKNDEPVLVAENSEDEEDTMEDDEEFEPEPQSIEPPKAKKSPAKTPKSSNE